MYSEIKLNTGLIDCLRSDSCFDSYGEDFTKVDVAILSALPEEIEFLLNYFLTLKFFRTQINGLEYTIYSYQDKNILLGCTGIGAVFASSIITQIYDSFRPDYILFTGTAGGIDKNLKLCDVVIVENAFEAEAQSVFDSLKDSPFESCLKHPLKKEYCPQVFSANQFLLDLTVDIGSPNSDIKIHKGVAVSSNIYPAPEYLFERIKEKRSLSIDMETSAVYQVAWLLNIPVIAVRGISNILTHDGYEDKQCNYDIKGGSMAASKVILNILDLLLLQYVPIHKSKENLSISKEAESLINLFNLQPHPEGGFFSQIFKSKSTVKSTDADRYGNENRSAGTSIYYLLNKNDFSAWHRLKSDEIWHYKMTPAV